MKQVSITKMESGYVITETYPLPPAGGEQRQWAFTTLEEITVFLKWEWEGGDNAS